MSRFTISLSGLAEADAARFRTALETLPSGPWKLVDAQAAYLMVVDVDTVWGHMDWLRATAGDQRVVVYSERSEAHDGEWLLTKPLRAEALHALLDEVAGTHAPAAGAATAAPAPSPQVALEPAAPAPGIPEPHETAAAIETTKIETAKPVETVESARAATAAPAVTPPSAETPPAAPSAESRAAAGTGKQPAPVETAPAPIAATAEPTPAPVPPPSRPATLGEQLLAGGIDAPLRIDGDDGVVLQLDPERGGYYGPLTLKSLQPLLSSPMDAAHALDETALARARLAPALPLARLLWFAALCATPGMLSAGLDPASPYRLTRWPQIEREFPRHFRIATTMMKQPGTLEEIATAANAPVGDVADFINAYCAAGYVAADATAAEPATGHSPGMLSRLRRPFARGGQEPA